MKNRRQLLIPAFALALTAAAGCAHPSVNGQNAPINPYGENEPLNITDGQASRADLPRVTQQPEQVRTAQAAPERTAPAPAENPQPAPDNNLGASSSGRSQ